MTWNTECYYVSLLLDLERKEQELEQLRMDREHFKARLETVQADSMREKKVRCSQTATASHTSVMAAPTEWCGGGPF